jgi:hypothetical protein
VGDGEKLLYGVNGLAGIKYSSLAYDLRRTLFLPGFPFLRYPFSSWYPTSICRASLCLGSQSRLCMYSMHVCAS